MGIRLCVGRADVLCENLDSERRQEPFEDHSLGFSSCLPFRIPLRESSPWYIWSLLDKIVFPQHGTAVHINILLFIHSANFCQVSGQCYKPKLQHWDKQCFICPVTLAWGRQTSACIVMRNQPQFPTPQKGSLVQTDGCINLNVCVTRFFSNSVLTVCTKSYGNREEAVVSSVWEDQGGPHHQYVGSSGRKRSVLDHEIICSKARWPH